MKQGILCLWLAAVVLGGLVDLGAECPEQYVPNANNICIRPYFIDGCQLYKNTHECATCAEGFEKDQKDVGKCVLVLEGQRPGLIGCLKGDKDHCYNCANGYRRSDGICLKGVEFCADYGKDGECLRCDNEYSWIFGECRHNLLLGCKVEQADHTCLECFKPFHLDNYQCVIPNCKSYNDYGCYACECGFFITPTHSCQKMDDGCLKTYRGTCTECLPHYKLKGGVCQIEGCKTFEGGLCAACDPRYDLVEGTCRYKNCFDWQDDRCVICQQGYHLQEGECLLAAAPFVCEG